MKKLIIVLSTLFITLSNMAANNVENNRYITKDYDMKDFTGIVASGIVEVQLTKSNACKVSVTMPDELEDYLDVKVTNGKLNISMRQVPLKFSKKYGVWSVTAKVSMPVLRSLSMSGASKLECDSSFDLGNDTFKLELSGASRANGLVIKAKELEVEMGGATSATVSGVFQNADLEMGGASKCTFEIDADQLHQEISGGAKAYHTGGFGLIELEASGASVFSLKGAADTIDLEASGASKVETSQGPARAVKARISGATYCEVNALETLKVDASGASSLRYVGNAGMDLDLLSISRGSSVTKMRE